MKKAKGAAHRTCAGRRPNVPDVRSKDSLTRERQSHTNYGLLACLFSCYCCCACYIWSPPPADRGCPCCWCWCCSPLRHAADGEVPQRRVERVRGGGHPAQEVSGLGWGTHATGSYTGRRTCGGENPRRVTLTDIQLGWGCRGTGKGYQGSSGVPGAWSQVWAAKRGGRGGMQDPTGVWNCCCSGAHHSAAQ